MRTLDMSFPDVSSPASAEAMGGNDGQIVYQLGKGSFDKNQNYPLKGENEIYLAE
jgi:hypothetical protein